VNRSSTHIRTQAADERTKIGVAPAGGGPRALPRKGRARPKNRATPERGGPDLRISPGGRDAAYLR